MPLAALMAVLMPTTASAKQCVFNKGGYVMQVQWYRQQDLGTYLNATDMTSLTALQAPVQTDTLALGQGSCTRTDETLSLVASVAASAGSYGAKGFRAGSGFVQSGMPAALYVVAASVHDNKIFTDKDGRRVDKPIMVPMACRPHLLKDGDCLTDGSRASLSPNGFNWFLVAQPPTTHYIDFWGTVFDVRWGQGGPIR